MAEHGYCQVMDRLLEGENNLLNSCEEIQEFLDKAVVELSLMPNRVEADDIAYNIMQIRNYKFKGEYLFDMFKEKLCGENNHINHMQFLGFKKHDCTKDNFYKLVMISVHEFNKKEEEEEDEKKYEWSKEFISVVKDEFDRHAAAEPHHPKYELLTGKHCSDEDVVETAFDIMLRSVQFCPNEVKEVDVKGLLDEKCRYKPKWQHDQDRKLALFYETIRNNHERVTKSWNDAFNV